MTPTMTDTIEVGDSVAVSYIMYEESGGQWVHYFDGEVVEIEGPEYAHEYRVRRADTGEVKDVSSTHARVDPT